MLSRQDRTFAILLIVALLASSLAGASTSTFGTVHARSSSDDWPMFHHDPAQAGFTNGSAPKSSPTLIWSTSKIDPETGSTIKPPVIADGAVYVAARFLHAYNSTTGQILWMGTDDVATFGQPVIVDGVIYMQGIAFNAATGSKIWETPVGSGGASAGVVSVADGYVYTKGKDHNGLVGLNASTGKLVWSSGYYCSSPSPAVSNGKVYFTGYNGSFRGIIALDAYTGSQVWSHKVVDANSAFTSPCVDVNYVLVKDYDNLLCLNASSGEQIWSYNLGHTKYFYESSPALAYGYVYIGSSDGNLYAFNASNGEKAWSHLTSKGFEVESSPAIADGTVYVASNDGYLYAFNAFTGYELWDYKIGEPYQHLHCSPAIANGCIYVGSEDTFMMALGQTPFWIEITIISSVIAAIVISGLFVYRRRIKANRKVLFSKD